MSDLGMVEFAVVGFYVFMNVIALGVFWYMMFGSLKYSLLPGRENK